MLKTLQEHCTKLYARLTINPSVFTYYSWYDPPKQCRCRGGGGVLVGTVVKVKVGELEGEVDCSSPLWWLPLLLGSKVFTIMWFGFTIYLIVIKWHNTRIVYGTRVLYDYNRLSLGLDSISLNVQRTWKLSIQNENTVFIQNNIVFILDRQPSCSSNIQTDWV